MTSVSSISAAITAGISSISTTSTDTTLTEADVVQSKYEEYLQPAQDDLDKISANQSLISAYSSLSTLMTSLESSLTDLHDATASSSDVFSSRSAELTASSSDSKAEMSAVVSAGTTTGTHTIVINQVATTERIASGEVASGSATLGYSGTFTLAEADGTAVSITVSAGSTLSSLESSINNQTSTTGVTASILQVSGSEYRLVLTAADANQSIALTSVSGDDVAVSLGFLDSSGAYSDELQSAQPSIISVDGISNIQRNTNDITDVLEGVTLSLTQADPSATITMSINNNTTTAESAINSFVTAYNALRSFVETNQSVSSDGSTSSDETLFGDSLLRGVSDEVQNALSSMVNGNALAVFGITMNSSNELEVDSTSLESALQTSFSGVQSLFDFEATISSDDVVMTAHTGSSYSGSFTLNITTDGSGTITGVDADGNSSAFTISGDLIKGNDGTAYAGLHFYYGGSASTSVTVDISQGIGDQIYNTMDEYLNTASGLLTSRISDLQSQDTTLTSQASDIVDQANTYSAYLVNNYATLNSQMNTNSTNLCLIQTLLAYDTKS